MTSPSSSDLAAARQPVARVDRLQESLSRVGAALDHLLNDPPPDAVTRRPEWQAQLTEPLPRDGVGADAVVDQIADLLVPNGTPMTEPGFWGWITVAPSTVPLVAATAAALVAPQRQTITAFNLLEDLSLEWLAELCGLGPHMKGVYSSGGSVANLVALGAARQWAYEQHGIDVAVEGTAGLRPTVYASTEAHHTVMRSAAVLGIGRGNVRAVPVDDRLRMAPDALEQMLATDLAAGFAPVAVVATAGTTNTGTIDPLRALGQIAQNHGIWFHVDGAYGLPGILDERVAARFDGLELADSAIVDPHKWLNAPVGIAATFVRDRGVLHRAFTQEPAAYLETTGGEDGEVTMSLDAMGVPYADLAVELSAPPRGVQVWSILREQGRDGVAARMRRDNDFATRLADLARAHPRLELMLEPELSICCLRYLPEGSDVGGADPARLDALNVAILRRLHHETPYLPSSTRVGEAFVLRACFINPRTTADLIDGFAATVVRLGDELVAAR